MNALITYFFRFFLFLILQIFIFNQLELGFGIYFLICPLFVMLLPFEINVYLMLSIAFLMGGIIDVFSNTYGLHASALLFFAYLRPFVFKLFSPREGYDSLKKPSVKDQGHLWFFSTFGLLLIIYLLYFFILEAFSLEGLFLILQKTILSFILTYLLSLFLHIFLIIRPKKI